MERRKLEELAEEVATELRNEYDLQSAKAKTIAQLDSISDVKIILDLVYAVVTSIEELSKTAEKLTGREKKDLATLVLNKFINVKIKFVPRMIIDKVEGMVIGFAIDYLIAFLNKKFGKKWLED